MSFHNIRDKYGRFTKKNETTSRKRKNKVDIIKSKATTIINGFLLDASGSMNGKGEALVSGFNEIIIQGKADAIKTGITNKQFVAFFGDKYAPVDAEVDKLVYTNAGCGVKIKDAICYNHNLGMTALWESTYKLITKLEEELKKEPTAKVILTIFTDGGENSSSREWKDGVKIKSIIQQKQKNGWVINFMGAGSKEVVTNVATNVGIFASNTLNFSNDAAGTKRSMSKMSASRSSYTAAVATSQDSNIGFFSND